MKIKLILILLSFCLLACDKEPKANLIVTGKIEGVRKGDLYLQQLNDTLLVTLDSVAFFGNEDFKMKAYIEEPQLMFLYLKKFGDEEDAEYLRFFAEAGEFEFNSKLNTFSTAKASKAPVNQEKYEEYLKTVKRFNDQNLELITERMQTPQEDSVTQAKIDEKYARLLRSKYLYTVNFAFKNAEYEVAPFLVLTEAYDANKKLLDTVYNSLSTSVKESKYGLELKELIDFRNEEEEQQNIKVETLDDDA